MDANLLDIHPSSFEQQRTNDGSILVLLARVIRLVLGIIAVSVFYVLESGWKAIASANGWIIFFLVAKPIIDLTWRWEFIRFSEQRINIQAIAGIIVIFLACMRMVYSSQVKLI